MDAHALLKSHGWRGTGHTLHPTDDSTGLAKPLLLSRKDNTLGIGKKEHCTSDQWWLNAFDQQLQGLDTSKKGAVVQTVHHGALDKLARGVAGRYLGLYASFVRGGVLQGTISSSSSSSSPSASADSTPTPTTTTSESTPEIEGRARRGRGAETKEERKARRAAKRLVRAEKRARKSGNMDVESVLAARRQRKLDRKALETKAERRERKEAKRKRKEERRRAAGG